MDSDDEIFVFGSNEQGIHGAGAAKYAYKHKGAKWGVGVGLQGKSYAIPTRTIVRNTFVTLPLFKIKKYVDEFIDFANNHKWLIFRVTAIGTGYAKYNHRDIAPLFKSVPSNVILPNDWSRAGCDLCGNNYKIKLIVTDNGDNLFLCEKHRKDTWFEIGDD